MSPPSKEARVILALEAIWNNEKLSLRAAAKLYNIPYNTLRDRRAGKPARRDIPANLCKLMDLEEQPIIRYIIKLCTRVFHPRLSYVEDIVN